MGHDISAYKKGTANDENANEIAYLRIGAWNRHKANLFYAALNAEKCDGGVSGTGESRDYNLNEIGIAAKKAKYLSGEEEKEFTNGKADEMSDKMIGGITTMLTRKASKKKELTEQERVDNLGDILCFFQEILDAKEDVTITFC